MKKWLKKLSEKIRIVFGYGVMICLFAGGLTFVGYLVALLVGGTVAVEICEFIYKKVIPVIVYASTVLVLLGLLAMYLNGEKALTADKKKASKHKGEL
ncbi:MAG: hypothetical protein IJB84_02550 [Lachnospiraceae bacterium]|nr:hypothetical protein [Lachnospiraceae bacterium]